MAIANALQLEDAQAPSMTPAVKVKGQEVILTFDLLTLHFYSTSGVMRLNSVPNLSEIE